MTGRMAGTGEYGGAILYGFYRMSPPEMVP
jgi:hypothetical protein